MCPVQGNPPSPRVFPNMQSQRGPPPAAGISEPPQAPRGLDPRGLPAESDAWTLSAPPPSQASISFTLNSLILSPWSIKTSVSRHPVCLQVLCPGAKHNPQVLAQAVPALPRPRPAHIVPVRTGQLSTSTSSVRLSDLGGTDPHLDVFKMTKVKQESPVPKAC